MLKGSALYIVIIISLVIALICSTLVLAAYFFRGQYLVKSRFDRLQDNLSSGIHILLRTNDPAYLQGKTLNLFNNVDDSVRIKNTPWGIYDIGVVEAFKQKDTLIKVFSTAFAIDSSKWAAIYLIDEDRSVSVSGKTAIRGNAYLPKAGVKAAYVDNKAYEGDKRLVVGNIHDSQRSLPPLNDIRLNGLAKQFNNPGGTVNKNWHVDTLANSFRSPVNIVNLGNGPNTLKNTKLSGNIILYADTLLTIDSTATLNNVLVFAKAIVIKSGFHGSCQLFASDSISIDKNCLLEYPSCLGLLRYKSPTIGFPPQIVIGQNAQISGVIFTYEKEASALPATISLGKGARVNGQIYAQHILSTKDSVAVKGSVFTTRFMYQTTFSRYENYLINLKIDAPALSAYYLTSDLIPVASSEKKILQWLEVK
ncbi:hypothetical protein [Mucilaginibacter ginsenosidivorax]|uniref:Uncharacterized protein n=1 Tax=Mucilaginibacter ginsenosidivorax TaxID=862126 RepID=A0A5B8W8U8_9SPHI|nr:hypothetical protein [Mucilaginibacter ginsenosidivorax]QEC79322.1 hypothetical protein FSB76_26480 [Mucilaginibacter ginsenosidivorax]